MALLFSPEVRIAHQKGIQLGSPFTWTTLKNGYAYECICVYSFHDYNRSCGMLAIWSLTLAKHAAHDP